MVTKGLFSSGDQITGFKQLKFLVILLGTSNIISGHSGMNNVSSLSNSNFTHGILKCNGLKGAHGVA